MIFDYSRSLKLSETELEKWNRRINKINNKLCDNYYSDRDQYSLVVGSVGRGTAVSETSDIDVIFILPRSVYLQFDNYDSNGQSHLLQEIKNHIKELYPSTVIKGDGQVVSVNFSDGFIELVPAFEQTDGSFKFPDSNNGGAWKITKPIVEIEESIKSAEKTSHVYNCLCYLMRKWKNHVGFSFNGLLIDTLVAKYLEDETYSAKPELEILKELFVFISSQDRNREFWYALGSNQKIWNSDKGVFINKATKALKKFDDFTEEEVLKELFGYNIIESKSINEEFIEDKFLIDIRYNIRIDCEVFQNGFRGMKLSKYLKSRIKLCRGKTLEFTVLESNIPDGLNVKYYWKVRNVGFEARGRERGQIFLGKVKQTEHTSFNGKHYVECYVIHNGIVVARDKIEVPIDIINGS